MQCEPQRQARAAHPGGAHPISFHAPIDPAVFDAGLLAGIQLLIPPELLRVYLQDLDCALELMIDSPPTAPRLQSQAHNIVSQAGMLGLMRLCESARALEDACRAGAGQPAALIRCRAAADDIRLYALPAAEQSPEVQARTA